MIVYSQFETRKPSQISSLLSRQLRDQSIAAGNQLYGPIVYAHVLNSIQ